MLRILCTKSGKISAKKGGGLTLRHGRTLRILRYIPHAHVHVVYAIRTRELRGIKIA